MIRHAHPRHRTSEKNNKLPQPRNTTNGTHTMADGDDVDKTFDDLDAFFSAAANEDAEAMNQAAEQVAGFNTAADDATPPSTAQRRQTSAPVPAPPIPDEELLRETYGDMDLEGKYIAIDPEQIAGSSSEPFVLVPAHVHTLLPWWAWVTIAMSFVTLIAVWVLMPPIFLDRLATRLGDDSPSAAQSVMRQLVMKGDKETIDKLYDMAASPATGMTTRLRAVDTLSLIGAPDADRALLRLELASDTDSQVKEAAIAARKQREAYKSRGRQR